MAIPVLSPTSSNFVNINDPSSSPNLPLSYGLNSTSKWIYCNYPEKLRSDSFGDTNLGNKCLNQVTVPTGTHQIFYSYNTVNMTDTIKFGIQIFNPNPTSITFRKLYGGHADSAESGGWTGSILNSWSRYFASSPENSITISSNGSYWCLEESVPKSRIFSGSIRFSVSDAAIITVYAYKNKNMINGTAIPYLYNGDYGHQYSGYGNGYFFSANLTLKASELASGGKWFKTNCPTGLPNISINGTSQTSDLISIHLANPSSTTITPSANCNLGNWCAQYGFNLTLKNDTNTTKVFRGYLKPGSNNVDNWPIIVSGGLVFGVNFNNTTLGKNAWKWLEITVAPNSTYNGGNYQWILGTNSCHIYKHIFTVS